MRVLIIDDSPSILECTRTFLEKAGHAVVTASSLYEAALLYPYECDVVICDGFDGYGPQFLKVVRRFNPVGKTILHSADSRLVEQERERGFCSIVKGDSWGELLASVGEK